MSGRQRRAAATAGLGLALLLGCEPAEEIIADARAREMTRSFSEQARRQGRGAVDRAGGELRELRGRLRRGAGRLRERSEHLREALGRLQPPPSLTAAPPLPTAALRCAGDTCTIDQATADLLRAEPGRLLHEGVVVPEMAQGKLVGLTLLSLRAGGLGERLGLRPGDTLRAINGSGLAAIADDPALQRRLADGRRWTLTLVRGGRTIERVVAVEG